MKEKRPSLTAELTAVARAAESMKPENERVCYDPLAKHFLGTTFSIVTKSKLLTRIPAFRKEYVKRTKVEMIKPLQKIVEKS